MINNRAGSIVVLIMIGFLISSCAPSYRQIQRKNTVDRFRERISINNNWKYFKYESAGDADELIYDVRPGIEESTGMAHDEAAVDMTPPLVLKPWILPTGNRFIKDPSKRHVRPDGNPGADFEFVQGEFDDNSWQTVNLPHDWAIGGPFHEGWGEGVGGGMGRLPSPGVAWYRKKLNIPAADAGRSIFLDVDGAMSYAMVWLNGHLVGGWPFGYASWRVDLTPYVRPGGENQLAIRLDNPRESSRWYPGGGLYRNVWLTKTSPIHVGQWGVHVATSDVSAESARVHMAVTIDNDAVSDARVDIVTDIYLMYNRASIPGAPVAQIRKDNVNVAANSDKTFNLSTTIAGPKLWGPPPNQKPHLYRAVTSILQDSRIVDRCQTEFGIRSLVFDPDKGVLVNGEHIIIKGVNQHHDLGALGAAFNTRAAERQLEMLREMGCNAIRMAHNPPAPELLELTDRMGFLVVDESFDVWERKKTPHDFHLIYPDWHEQDMRALVRRDRNHPSVIMWSIGNEVGEQYTGEPGAAVGRRLHEIVAEEDPSRPTTAAMNYAKPDMPLPAVVDLIGLNYQGEGIRDAPAYSGLKGITTSPQYPAFRRTFPHKLILGSENAAALSTRGTYLFPVFDGMSAPVKDGAGGDPANQYVSAYELYTADFGSSADKVFASLDQHPFVAGGFVWSGWDYLGEPTPYYGARSSYFGVIDLAGFKKDRFYLYQSYWRPELPMAHILPHWNWPERIGLITPVHVFTSGDEVELFLNGRSLGRKNKNEYEYRLRWDDVVYSPGELKAVAYKDGRPWAEDVVVTTGDAAGLDAAPDRSVVRGDGKDLSFVTVRVVDENGRTCPRANNLLTFSIDGPGEIVATSNGDPTSFTPFPSLQREAFNGLCLAIVRGKPGAEGSIVLTVNGEGLGSSSARIQIERTSN